MNFHIATVIFALFIGLTILLSIEAIIASSVIQHIGLGLGAYYSFLQSQKFHQVINQFDPE